MLKDYGTYFCCDSSHLLGVYLTQKGLQSGAGEIPRGAVKTYLPVVVGIQLQGAVHTAADRGSHLLGGSLAGQGGTQGHLLGAGLLDNPELVAEL